MAFIGAAELALGMVRRSRAGGEGSPSAAHIAQDAAQAAHLALAASVAAGNPLSRRQLMTRFGLTRTAERKVRADVAAASNGHPTD